ncbi:Kelch repeat-containing protein [Sorangium cellulosum]|uniref:Kelch repeat-containing protein n=1 Tax=Sorangium cellulosum TaxID=56 RepID=UPI0006780C6B|nr:kelch motif-containing protein [Sorangium cellulosum]
MTSRRALPTPSPLLAAALLVGGCGAEPEETSAAALRLRFPEHADVVLSAREAFAPTEGGFRLAATEPGGAWMRAARPEVELPRDGSGAIRFRLADGGEIRVRELGAEGEGAMAERAVSYRRAGGTSFWTATDGGVEEWLLLEEGVARAGEVVAAWEVEGAQLRERGAAVELVDEARGAPVLRVTAPRAYAASGRPVAVALRARGARVELSINAGGEAVLVDPAWEPAGRRIDELRRNHTATLLLQSGNVLLAGGIARLGSLASAELYDPAGDTWSPVSQTMLAARYNHTATWLESGEVLVLGGQRDNLNAPSVEPVDTVELYDPETDTWTPRAAMATSRADHTATLLLDGKVLVTGGRAGVRTLSSAELYDPMTDTWTSAAPMNDARSIHAAVLLPRSGKVLAAGGVVRGVSGTSAELYDPETDTWTPTGALPGGDWFPIVLAQLPDGEVLAVGTLGAARYNPTAGTWSPTGPMIGLRQLPSATTLHNGMVLVAGEPYAASGSASYRSVELYDPETDAWTETAPTNGLHNYHSATRLLSGDVLLVGDAEYAERYSIVGLKCTSDDECGRGACVDGVCCESRCSEPCHTCAMPSSLGRCVLQPKGLDTRGDCAREGCDGSCDGLGACVAVPKGGMCAPAQCRDQTHSMAQVLCPADGASCAGSSSDAREVEDCAPYDCDQVSGTCKVECSSWQDCARGHACDFSGRCVPAPPAEVRGCNAGPAAAAAGGSRAGLGAALLALLAVAQRSASAFRGRFPRRRRDS